MGSPETREETSFLLCSFYPSHSREVSVFIYLERKREGAVCRETRKRILQQNSLAQHWARDWRALALTQVHHGSRLSGKETRQDAREETYYSRGCEQTHLPSGANPVGWACFHSLTRVEIYIQPTCRRHLSLRPPIPRWCPVRGSEPDCSSLPTIHTSRLLGS